MDCRDPTPIEQKFRKSQSNRLTENAGLRVLLDDPRFQRLPLDVKRLVGARFGISGRGINAFDAVMTDSPVPALTPSNFEGHLETLRLIEMKTTRKAIQDPGLGGFFFGATESEYALARRLGERYLFAFVVLNSDNVFGREFFVLLAHDELEARTRVKRVQYQVNLVTAWDGPSAKFGFGPVDIAPFSRAAEAKPPYGT